MNTIKTETNIFTLLVTGVRLTEEEVDMIEKKVEAYAKTLVEMVPTADTECLFSTSFDDGEPEGN